MASDATQFRRDFWTKYAELYPKTAYLRDGGGATLEFQPSLSASIYRWQC